MQLYQRKLVWKEDGSYEYVPISKEESDAKQASFHSPPGAPSFDPEDLDHVDEFDE